MAFYQFPSVTAMFIAVLSAFWIGDESLQVKFGIFARGAGNENVMTMLMIYILAGAFSAVAAAMGGRDSVVNLGISLIPVQFLTVGMFIISAFMGTATGTSMGTVASIVPIAAGVAVKSGISEPLMVAACVGGAMFGDNLSMISDTTIAATRTQGCEMKDKFKMNFLIVLPAAIITVVFFWFVTRNVAYDITENLDYNFWQVVPYLVVLIGALIGINVFLVLIGGTVISLIAGVATGNIVLADMFTVVGDGVVSMYDITVISILVACIVSLVKMNGGIQFILDQIKSRIHGAKGAQGGIALLSFLVDLCTANNTVAIVMTGPIAKEISDEFDVDPRRSASLLDMFTSVGQGLIPYGAQLLTAAALTGLTPFDFMPYLIYPMLMAVCGIVAICIRRERKSA